MGVFQPPVLLISTEPQRDKYASHQVPTQIGAASTKIGAASTKIGVAATKSARHKLIIGAAWTKNWRGMHGLIIGAAWSKNRCGMYYKIGVAWTKNRRGIN